MPRVLGIDHLVLSVGNFARSKAFYTKVLGFLGFKLKYDMAGLAGWSNRKSLFWIAAADAKGKKHNTARATSASTTMRSNCRAGTWTTRRLPRPARHDGARSARRVQRRQNYYAVFFADPDGMKLEGMVYTARQKPRPKKKTKKKQ
jgi:catechol 2,3-dioxygenase-like lactoylglutathione lyase family enzyme